MTLTIEGGKILEQGRLRFDAEAAVYRLEGSTPSGAPIAFDGTLDPETRLLTLDRRGPSPRGEERLTIRPNANEIRYTFRFDRKEPGAPQFRRLIEANLGKEGVNFAAGGAMQRGPTCIVTGGAATISVTAGGATFAVCCSGCRDEVTENPEKYVAKLKARTAAAGDGSKAIATGRGDGSFDLPTGRSGRGESPDAEPTKRDDTPAGAGDAPESKPVVEPAPEPKPTPEPAPEPDPASRRKADALLRLGRALETQGKADGALGFYRRIVAEHPESPAAEAAEERIKAIEGRRLIPSTPRGGTDDHIRFLPVGIVGQASESLCSDRRQAEACPTGIGRDQRACRSDDRRQRDARLEPMRRGRGLEAQRRSERRVLDGQRPGVQGDADREGPIGAVGGVAEDRQATRGGLHPELMCPAGPRPEPEPAAAARQRGARLDPIAGQGVPGPRRLGPADLDDRAEAGVPPRRASRPRAPRGGPVGRRRSPSSASRPRDPRTAVASGARPWGSCPRSSPPRRADRAGGRSRGRLHRGRRAGDSAEAGPRSSSRGAAGPGSTSRRV